ncbi:MarR family winged helix-turn-helix transcriptional regulator [Thalassotalea aquiviva]|uniref:MarR family winged helix-turn-helix transcriptional regulator n=1 Tax=Thalassotalea aquiviva TaxID=3242415 RepID=UPI00352A891E
MKPISTPLGHLNFMTTGTLTLQDFLPYRLSALSNRISQSLASQYSAQFGLSVQEWRILAVLGEANTLSAVAITNRIAMDKVAVSRAVKKLIEKGLIQKCMDESDNRRFELALTATGRETYNKLTPIALAHEQRVVAKLNESEQQLLFDLLNKLDTTAL